MSGDKTIGIATFSITPFHWTNWLPAMAAPTSPPMRACDEDDGIPNHQVMRFHAIAPSRAAATTSNPSVEGVTSMMPLPTVFATPSERKAPIKLPIAAISKAVRAFSALVATEVAIAFAAS